MVGVETPRGALQRLAFEREGGCEVRLVHDPAPSIRVLDNGFPDLSGGGGVRPPYAGAGEHHAGLELQVEARSVYVSPHLVAEVDTGVCLVGGLVLREADVPVDAEHRPARPPGVGHHVGADAGQLILEVGHKLEKGILDVGSVPLLVGLEPVAPVVDSQFPQEVEQGGREVRHDPSR